MKNKSGSKSIMDSVEILRVIKKLKELLRQEGVSPPPCPTLVKILFFRVQLGYSKKNFRDFEIIPYPNRGRQSGGAEPGNRD